MFVSYDTGASRAPARVGLAFLAGLLLLALAIVTPVLMFAARPVWLLVGGGLALLAAGVYPALAIARRGASRVVEHSATAERLLSRAVEQTADLVMICNRDGVIEYVNPAFEALTGYVRDEAVGKTPRILKSGRHEREYYTRLWDTILAGSAFRDIVVNRKKGGDLYYEEKTITPVRDGRGAITHFISTGKDITERYQAEEALRAIVEGTSGATGEVFFRSLVKHLALALRARYAYLGELVGENRTRLQTLAVWNGSGFGENSGSVLVDIPCHPGSAHATCVYPQGVQERFPDNSVLRDMGVESYLGVRLVAASGEVLGLLAVMDTQPMDGTEHGEAIVRIFAARAAAELERIRAEEAVRVGEEQLRQLRKMEVVGQLAGGIAHDFNNLLTVMTGGSDALLVRLRPQDPSRHEVVLIKEAAERAAALTRQLLAFSRKQTFRLEVLDLNAIVAGMSRLLRRLIGEHVELVTVLDPGLGRTRADAGQIDQVLVNLAVNARDAMPHGGRLTIETGNVDVEGPVASRDPDAPSGACIFVRVADTGTGIAPEIRTRIFDPFFTTKAPGLGTGLGLSTVYGIVKQHEGHIAVDSAPGPGTTFTVYLRRVQDLASPPAVRAARSR